MAEAYYAQIAPHLYCGPVVGAANVQLSACSPNFLILESIEHLGRLPRRDPEDGDPLGGRLCHPRRRAGPRRGADEEVARAHPYAGRELHIVPHAGPVAPPD